MNAALAAQLLAGVARVFVSPFFYLGLALAAVQYLRQTRLERRVFGVRVTDWRWQALLSAALGLLVGIAATAGMAAAGVALNRADLAAVWLLTVFLAVIRIRFICFSYAGGLLSLFSLALRQFPPVSGSAWLETAWQAVANLQAASLLSLVAVLHLAEAALVLLQGHRDPGPVFLSGKRGRIVGGFVLQKFWLLPLAVVVNGGTALAGWQVFPLPAILAFSGVSISSTPAQKARRTAFFLLVYAGVLLLLSQAGRQFPVLLWLAGIWSPAVHEAMIRLENRLEQQAAPRYIKAMRGLRILSVLPGSPAALMGLKPEEVIVKVNDCPVSSAFDLHFAINQNPAYARLEIQDAAGEVRFVHKPVYDGAHHALGIILVPDEQAREYVRLEALPLWKLIWGRLHASEQGISGSSTHSA